MAKKKSKKEIAKESAVDVTIEGETAESEEKSIDSEEKARKTVCAAIAVGAACFAAAAFIFCLWSKRIENKK